MSNLQKTLFVNALFSFSTGLALIFQYENIASAFGLKTQLFFLYLGIALVFFSGTVFYEFKKLRKRFIELIIIQDVLWVIGSILVLAFSLVSTSTAYWIITIVAFIVGLFALLQYKWSRLL